MIRIVLIFVFSCFALQYINAQTEKHWVFFKDKAESTFNPHEYFDQKAMDRRIKNGLSLVDSTDFPVSEKYLSSVSEIADSVSSHSRWFNCVAVYVSGNQLASIESLPFVKNTSEFPRQDMILAEAQKNRIEDTDNDYLTENDRALLEAQTDRMGRSDFSKAGIDGSGIRVAIFDAGFSDVDFHPCFKHIRDAQMIKSTYDFIKKRDNVFLGSTHGTNVLSCIAGVFKDNTSNRTDTFGCATGAEFLLARTEKLLFEVYSEEENWLAAVEWADKNGADIINSSLGYTGQRYTYEDMTGNMTLVSRAGNLAAKKGILVVNSAGNDGSNSWNFVGAPADADSVLAVGGLNPWTGVQTSFSSVGPSYDYTLKPNVTAYGHVIAAQKKGENWETQGTSFSSPLVAGFAACLWQLHPEWNNMELFRALETGADLYPYFDYAHGYGTPLASNYLDSVETEVESTLKYRISGDEIRFTVNKAAKESDARPGEFQLMFGENSYECNLDYKSYLFVHFENKEGNLTNYYVYEMAGEKNLELNLPAETKVIRCHYNGFTKIIKL